MKYFLFVNFSNGLMHNNVYSSLKDVRESVIQLAQDENLEIKKENIPSTGCIKKHLKKSDDYFGQLSNDTWFHIQPQNIFEIVK